MADSFIETLHLQKFGCIADLKLRLSRIHALIGPNDSGKSTVLRALRTACQFGGGAFIDAGRGAWKPFFPAIKEGWPEGEVRLEFQGEVTYAIKALPDGNVREKIRSRDNEDQHESQPRAWNGTSLLDTLDPNLFSVKVLRDALKPARQVRLDPDSLMAPSALIPSDAALDLLNEKGVGLAAIYDAIVNRNVDGFIAIRNDVQRLFPSVKTIGFNNTADGRKELEFELVGGSRVSARYMSAGLLFYLAFAALPHLAPTNLVLVEEPENGLHPARIVEVMSILRELSKTTQVVLATHSPLVVNELQPEEVTVLVRDAAGVHGTLMKDTANFPERSSVYALGELWLSYANGEDEKPLLKGVGDE